MTTLNNNQNGTLVAWCAAGEKDVLVEGLQLLVNSLVVNYPVRHYRKIKSGNYLEIW